MRPETSTGIRTRRLCALALAGAAALSVGGCEWSLSIESGGASLVEQLIEQFGNHISGNEIVPNGQDRPAGGQGPGQAGAAGGGGAAGGAGAGSAAGGSSGPSEPVTPPEVAERLPSLPDPVFALIAGRPHRVVSLSVAAPQPGGHDSEHAVLLIARTTPAGASTGVVAECGLRVPADLWPADAAGAPLAVSFTSAAPADAQPAAQPGAIPPDTLTLGGKSYALTLASARLGRAADGAVKGVIEAIAQCVADKPGPAPKQLLRIVFAGAQASH